MRTVYKFPLTSGWNVVTVGVGTWGPPRVVLAAIDPASGAPTVWIEHDPDGRSVTRSFTVFGTGAVVPEQAEHVGSMVDGQMVWHVYGRIG